MKTICSNRKAGGFSFFDLLVVLLIVLLAVMLVFILMQPRLGKPHGSATPKMKCLNNLKQVGLCFRLWASDHEGNSVMAMSTNIGGTMEFNETGQVYRHFLAMSNELGRPKILFCPSDNQRTNATLWASFGNQNISYFLGLEADETKPQMILAGDRNITGGVLTNGNLMLCKSNTVLSWTKAIHNQCGNIALADGSVQQVPNEGLQNQHHCQQYNQQHDQQIKEAEPTRLPIRANRFHRLNLDIPLAPIVPPPFPCYFPRQLLRWRVIFTQIARFPRSSAIRYSLFVIRHSSFARNPITNTFH